MQSKYHHRYRIDSTRLPNWDYSQPAYYFVTFCTCERKPFFGWIQNGQLVLSYLGKIAHEYWLKIPDHFSNADLNEFVIMPNHVHGIVIITEPPVETQHAASLQPGIEYSPSKPQTAEEMALLQTTSNPLPKTGSLSALIRSYKSAVSHWAHRNGYPDFSWQGRFIEHIIRTENSLNRIRKYIQDNPVQWELDKYKE